MVTTFFWKVLNEVLKICEKMISLFIYKYHFSFNTEAIFANVKINVKQSEMKDLVAVHLYRKYHQNLK